METILAVSRAQVAPLKRMTVPRLELDAAWMDSVIALSLVDELDFMVVLYLIRESSNKYRNYVAHRIVDISPNLEALSVSGQRRIEIRYVPTSLDVSNEY